MSDPQGATLLAQASVPAKAILFGEHAVVYGRPAIALPVPQLQVTAIVRPDEGSLKVDSRYAGANGPRMAAVDLATAGPTEPLAAAARAALRHAGRTERTPWRVSLESSIPAGRGLGSSAAVAVAVVTAVGRAAEPEEAWGPQTIAELALEAERCVHGQASGIDTAVCAHAAPIYFQQGQARPLLLGCPLTLLIADSGLRGSTAEMVAGVRARQAEHPHTYAEWFDRVGRLADDAVRALAEGSPRWLGQLMNVNHLALQAMHVSTPQLDQLVAAARHAGAWGAKLTGSGGGGAVIALVDDETLAAVSAALSAAGAVSVLPLSIPPSG
ncbi:MAG: mevalonate kinase [Anaerolineae bacterium]|nr:mevalonate kinase [Ardenticatenia bacterium]MBK8540705.1 mevalonate kinase [Ardenticatenia bacterium]HQZ70660.1 mevalonate kinase [Anaerolineae bacterium]HRA20691.1 mevalonate kinase [Anaerolineae bacterium]